MLTRTVMLAGIVILSVGSPGAAARRRTTKEVDTAGKVHAVDKVVTSAERVNDVFGPHSLTLPAPIVKWDNGIPLGNGLTGGLLWGKGGTVNLSLDRGDLWDERSDNDYDPALRTFATMIKCYRDRDRTTWDEVFKNPNKTLKWTKIPGGRLVITLPAGIESRSFHLDFEKATGKVALSDGTEGDIFFSATMPVAMIRLPKGSSFRLIRPASIDQLGYPEPEFRESGNEVAYTQKTTDAFNYAVAVQWKDDGDRTLALVAITNSNEAEDPLSLARERIADGMKEGRDSLYRRHLAWWKEFYNTSTVTVPRPRLQHHYNLVKYYYGAASRAHAKPMPLQGVWTADGGGLPPWRGDYHNDLNTQMTYVAFHAAGLIEPGMAYLNFYWDRLPQFRRYGSAFFGTDGAMVPGVMTLGGRAMGGWIQYAHLVCAGLWNGHAFYRHWKVTRDEEFLAERAYPWLSEIATSVFSLTREEDGYLVLPVSCSPEWSNDKWTAFLKPNSNFDQSLLLWAAEALEEMATALGRPDDARKWASLRAKLAPLKRHEKTGALLISEGVSYGGGHRHFSHALAIHPLSILHIDQSEEARKAVRATVRQIIDGRRRGWVGYSFSSAAGLAARAGFADDAERLLVDFERAFVTRNGFHVNGDQSWTILPGQRRKGSRAFTLEGNFLFMDAVHEMYMQSFGGKVRIFPAVPDSWKDAAFTDLRAEGGFVVSARRAGGLTREVKVRARRDSTLRLRDPFAGPPASGSAVARQDAGRKATWSRPHERKDDCLLFDLRAGEAVTGSAAQ